MEHLPIENLRKEYKGKELCINNTENNPMDQFRQWFEEALMLNIEECNAFCLATCSDAKGISSRFVLMKEYSEKGIIFYTNYGSRKAQTMDQDSGVAATFFWKELERQVRFEGRVKKISTEKSGLYFDSRPLGSRIAAIVSPQSAPIQSRKELEAQFIKMQKESNGKDLKKPEQWGGYLIQPAMVEFWQGRENRLHDRIAYFFTHNKWKKQRLAP